MNPLTQIKNTQKISREEIAAGYSDSQSWHARFKHSAYIYAGGLPFSLTDGDLLAIFAQYGEVIDVNLVRHQDTGKPRGFAFLAYEDQRSTVLAVDNLNGCTVAGRIITVDHVDNYKRKRAEMEGREESESEDEEVGGEEEAEADAMRAALGDGAQVVSQADARAGDSNAEDMPWAAKSTVFALLNSEQVPERPPPAAALEEEEDPMLLMQKHKKLKKEKKSKRKKDKKEKKEARKKAAGASSDTSTPPRGDAAQRRLPSAPHDGRLERDDQRRDPRGDRDRGLDPRDDGRRGQEARRESRGGSDAIDRDHREGHRGRSERDGRGGQHRRDDSRDERGRYDRSRDRR